MWNSSMVVSPRSGEIVAGNATMWITASTEISGGILIPVRYAQGEIVSPYASGQFLTWAWTSINCMASSS
jgi:hypothetical protein